MFLLPSLVLGVIFAMLLGGRPGRLAEVRFRLAWTVPVALVLQLIIFGQLGEGLDQVSIERLHVASYVLLLAFAAANFRLRVLVPVLLGLMANATAIIANHGLMPVSASAARADGLSPGVHENVFVGPSHLGFLGDVFALPSGLPLANVFSIGDILIGIGMIMFVVLVSIHDDGEPVIEPSRLLEPFRTSNYRVLAAGKLVSHAGDWITLTALVGWIYAATGSTGQAALLLLARLAPPVLGGGIAAFVVDRLPKQRLLVWIELARGLAVAMRARRRGLGGRTGSCSSRLRLPARSRPSPTRASRRFSRASCRPSSSPRRTRGSGSPRTARWRSARSARR